jgi:uncharacterized protein
VIRQTFLRRSLIAAPAQTVFDWHSRPGAFERLIPPWEGVRLLQRTGDLRDGSRVILSIRQGLFRRRWVVEHRDVKPPEQFRDVQIEGPFSHWDHLHRFEAKGTSECFLEDRVEYSLPFGWLGNLLGGGYVRRKLERLFDYRHHTTSQDIALHHSLQGGIAMKFLVTGSSGLIGSALIPFLTAGGHSVTRLLRSPASSQSVGASEIVWNPGYSDLPISNLEGFDAVIHLAGESIAEGRWTDAKKARIRESRTTPTRALSDGLAKLNRPPRVLVCASAIGYYGNRGDEILREGSAPGKGYLPDVCLQWEGATAAAVQKGIRVVNLRFGVVLSPHGGALAKMLPPFRMGVGGKVGDGKQYMSWIALDDAIGAIYHAATNDRLTGGVNAVSPNPVTNLEFTKTLGRVLSRPTLFPVPAAAARIAFGEMADALLLASARVLPSRLLETGYQFRYAELEGALRHLLNK